MNCRTGRRAEMDWMNDTDGFRYAKIDACTDTRDRSSAGASDAQLIEAPFSGWARSASGFRFAARLHAQTTFAVFKAPMLSALWPNSERMTSVCSPSTGGGFMEPGRSPSTQTGGWMPHTSPSLGCFML